MPNPPTAGETVKLLALYLPQFHPIPENDKFWGTGFTEWDSTVAAKPRFPDHRQPRLVGELGRYDLRIAEVAYQQEALAAEYGIDAFVYYHYWFHGHRVMGSPLDAKLADTERPLPFALCWANHDWNRNQNGLAPELLIEQRYSESDDQAHAEFLAAAFADPRYLRTDGRPVFFMYRTQEHPAPTRFADMLRAACSAAGVADPYLVRFETNGSDQIDPALHHFDAGADLHPHWLWHTPADQRPARLAVGMPDDFWMQYDAVAAASSARSTPTWKRFPCIVPDWDTTARKPLGGAFALHRSSAVGYETWLAREITRQQHCADGPRLVVLNAWNEWSECGYLEPDAEQGRALLEATARAKGIAAPLTDEHSYMEEDLKMYDFVVDPQAEASAHKLLLELIPAAGTVLELGCAGGHLTEKLQQRRHSVTAVDIFPYGAAKSAPFAVKAFDIDLDRHVLGERLRGQQFDCVVLADTLQHVRSPTRVVTDALSLLAPGGTVVVSVPNVAHIDARLMLLQGQWAYKPTGALADSHLRFFTRDSLQSLLADCGLTPHEWRRTERPAFSTNLAVDPALLPTVLVEQLLTDPDATTYQFIVSARLGVGADQIKRPVVAPLRISLPAAAFTTPSKIRRLPRAIYRRVRRLVRRGPA